MWRTGSGSVRVADFMPSQTGTGPHLVRFGNAAMGQCQEPGPRGSSSIPR